MEGYAPPSHGNSSGGASSYPGYYYPPSGGAQSSSPFPAVVSSRSSSSSPATTKTTSRASAPTPVSVAISSGPPQHPYYQPQHPGYPHSYSAYYGQYPGAEVSAHHPHFLATTHPFERGKPCEGNIASHSSLAHVSDQVNINQKQAEGLDNRSKDPTTSSSTAVKSENHAAQYSKTPSYEGHRIGGHPGNEYFYGRGDAHRATEAAHVSAHYGITHDLARDRASYFNHERSYNKPNHQASNQYETSASHSKYSNSSRTPSSFKSNVKNPNSQQQSLVNHQQQYVQQDVHSRPNSLRHSSIRDRKQEARYLTAKASEQLLSAPKPEHSFDVTKNLEQSLTFIKRVENPYAKKLEQSRSGSSYPNVKVENYPYPEPSTVAASDKASKSSPAVTRKDDFVLDLSVKTLRKTPDSTAPDFETSAAINLVTKQQYRDDNAAASNVISSSGVPYSSNIPYDFSGPSSSKNYEQPPLAKNLKRPVAEEASNPSKVPRIDYQHESHNIEKVPKHSSSRSAHKQEHSALPSQMYHSNLDSNSIPTSHKSHAVHRQHKESMIGVAGDPVPAKLINEFYKFPMSSSPDSYLKNFETAGPGLPSELSITYSSQNKGDTRRGNKSSVVASRVPLSTYASQHMSPETTARLMADERTITRLPQNSAAAAAFAAAAAAANNRETSFPYEASSVKMHPSHHQSSKSSQRINSPQKAPFQWHSPQYNSAPAISSPNLISHSQHTDNLQKMNCPVLGSNQSSPVIPSLSTNPYKANLRPSSSPFHERQSHIDDPSHLQGSEHVKQVVPPESIREPHHSSLPQYPHSTDLVSISRGSQPSGSYDSHQKNHNSNLDQVDQDVLKLSNKSDELSALTHSSSASQNSDLRRPSSQNSVLQSTLSTEEKEQFNFRESHRPATAPSIGQEDIVNQTSKTQSHPKFQMREASDLHSKAEKLIKESSQSPHFKKDQYIQSNSERQSFVSTSSSISEDNSRFDNADGKKKESPIVCGPINSQSSKPALDEEKLGIVNLSNSNEGFVRPLDPQIVRSTTRSPRINSLSPRPSSISPRPFSRSPHPNSQSPRPSSVSPHSFSHSSQNQSPTMHSTSPLPYPQPTQQSSPRVSPQSPSSSSKLLSKKELSSAVTSSYIRSESPMHSSSSGAYKSESPPSQSFNESTPPADPTAVSSQVPTSQSATNLSLKSSIQDQQLPSSHSPRNSTISSISSEISASKESQNSDQHCKSASVHSSPSADSITAEYKVSGNILSPKSVLQSGEDALDQDPANSASNFISTSDDKSVHSSTEASKQISNLSSKDSHFPLSHEPENLVSNPDAAPEYPSLNNVKFDPTELNKYTDKSKISQEVSLGFSDQLSNPLNNASDPSIESSTEKQNCKSKLLDSDDKNLKSSKEDTLQCKPNVPSASNSPVNSNPFASKNISNEDDLGIDQSYQKKTNASYSKKHLSSDQKLSNNNSLSHNTERTNSESTNSLPEDPFLHKSLVSTSRGMETVQNQNSPRSSEKSSHKNIPPANSPLIPNVDIIQTSESSTHPIHNQQNSESSTNPHYNDHYLRYNSRNLSSSQLPCSMIHDNQTPSLPKAPMPNTDAAASYHKDQHPGFDYSEYWSSSYSSSKSLPKTTQLSTSSYNSTHHDSTPHNSSRGTSHLPTAEHPFYHQVASQSLQSRTHTLDQQASGPQHHQTDAKPSNHQPAVNPEHQRTAAVTSSHHPAAVPSSHHPEVSPSSHRPAVGAYSHHPVTVPSSHHPSATANSHRPATAPSSHHPAAAPSYHSDAAPSSWHHSATSHSSHHLATTSTAQRLSAAPSSHHPTAAPSSHHPAAAPLSHHPAPAPSSHCPAPAPSSHHPAPPSSHHPAAVPSSHHPAIAPSSDHPAATPSHLRAAAPSSHHPTPTPSLHHSATTPSRQSAALHSSHHPTSSGPPSHPPSAVTYRDPGLHVAHHADIKSKHHSSASSCHAGPASLPHLAASGSHPLDSHLSHQSTIPPAHQPSVPSQQSHYPTPHSSYYSATYPSHHPSAHSNHHLSNHLSPHPSHYPANHPSHYVETHPLSHPLAHQSSYPIARPLNYVDAPSSHPLADPENISGIDPLSTPTATLAGHPSIHSKKHSEVVPPAKYNYSSKTAVSEASSNPRSSSSHKSRIPSSKQSPQNSSNHNPASLSNYSAPGALTSPQVHQISAYSPFPDSFQSAVQTSALPGSSVESSLNLTSRYRISPSSSCDTTLSYSHDSSSYTYNDKSSTVVSQLRIPTEKKSPKLRKDISEKSKSDMHSKSDRVLPSTVQSSMPLSSQSSLYMLNSESAISYSRQSSQHTAHQYHHSTSSAQYHSTPHQHMAPSPHLPTSPEQLSSIYTTLSHTKSMQHNPAVSSSHYSPRSSHQSSPQDQYPSQQRPSLSPRNAAPSSHHPTPPHYPAPSPHHPAPSLHHPATSPHHPAPSPHHPAPSSHHPAPSPHHPAPSPHHPAPSPHHPAPTPRHPAPSSHHPAPSSHHPAPSSHHPAASPHHPAPSPHHPAPSPHHPAASPHHPAASPHHPAPSHHPASSPHHLAPSPHHPAPSPHHPAPSPHHPAPSPHHPAPSPHHPAPSPHHPAPSPRHPAPSPRHPAPSPRHPAPSPRHPAPSPRHPAPSPRHPAPSPHHPAPSSHHPAPSSHHPAPSSHHPAPSPHHPAPSPHHPAPSPHHPAPSPHHPAPSPHHPAPSPHHPAPSPHHPAPSPHHPASSPHYPASSPHHPAPSPHHPAPSPHHPAPSPHHPAPSPHHPAPSPHHPAPSPHHPAPSPHPRHPASSPHPRHPSPHHLPPSPHHPPPSPHHSAPSPRHSAPSPRHPLPSPHHSAPPPRHPAPSPRHPAPSSHHSAPSSHHSAPSSHHSAPSSHHSAPSSHHSAPSSHHSAPSPHHSAPSPHHPASSPHHPAQSLHHPTQTPYHSTPTTQNSVLSRHLNHPSPHHPLHYPHHPSPSPHHPSPSPHHASPSPHHPSPSAHHPTPAHHPSLSPHHPSPSSHHPSPSPHYSSPSPHHSSPSPNLHSSFKHHPLHPPKPHHRHQPGHEVATSLPDHPQSSFPNVSGSSHVPVSKRNEFSLHPEYYSQSSVSACKVTQSFRSPSIMPKSKSSKASPVISIGSDERKPAASSDPSIDSGTYPYGYPQSYYPYLPYPNAHPPTTSQNKHEKHDNQYYLGTSHYFQQPHYANCKDGKNSDYYGRYSDSEVLKSRTYDQNLHQDSKFQFSNNVSHGDLSLHRETSNLHQLTAPAKKVNLSHSEGSENKKPTLDDLDNHRIKTKAEQKSFDSRKFENKCYPHIKQEVPDESETPSPLSNRTVNANEIIKKETTDEQPDDDSVHWGLDFGKFFTELSSNRDVTTSRKTKTLGRRYEQKIAIQNAIDNDEVAPPPLPLSEPESESESEAPVKFRGKFKSIKDKSSNERIILTYASHSDESCTELIPDEDASDFEEELQKEISERKKKRQAPKVRKRMHSSSEEDIRTTKGLSESRALSASKIVRGLKIKKLKLESFTKEDDQDFSPGSFGSESNSSSSDDSESENSATSDASYSKHLPKKRKLHSDSSDDSEVRQRPKRSQGFSRSRPLSDSSEEDESEKIRRKRGKKKDDTDDDDAYKPPRSTKFKNRSNKSLKTKKHSIESSGDDEDSVNEKENRFARHKKCKNKSRHHRDKNKSSSRFHNRSNVSSSSESDCKERKMNKKKDANKSLSVTDSDNEKSSKSSIRSKKRTILSETDSESEAKSGYSKTKRKSGVVYNSRSKSEEENEADERDQIIAKLERQRLDELQRDDVIREKAKRLKVSAKIKEKLDSLHESKFRQSWSKPKFGSSENFHLGWEEDLFKFKKDFARLPGKLLRSKSFSSISIQNLVRQNSSNSLKSLGKATPAKNTRSKSSSALKSAFLERSRIPNHKIVEEIIERVVAGDDPGGADSDCSSNVRKLVHDPFPAFGTARAHTGLTPTPSVAPSMLGSDESDTDSLVSQRSPASDSAPLTRRKTAFKAIMNKIRKKFNRVNSACLNKPKARILSTCDFSPKLLPTPGLDPASQINVKLVNTFFRKDTVEANREVFDELYGEADTNVFSTTLLQSRTRKETKLRLDEATIKAVFGDVPPKTPEVPLIAKKSTGASAKQRSASSNPTTCSSTANDIFKTDDSNSLPPSTRPSTPSESGGFGSGGEDSEVSGMAGDEALMAGSVEGLFGLNSHQKATRKYKRKTNKSSGWDYMRKKKKPTPKVTADEESLASTAKKKVVSEYCFFF